MIQPLQIIFLRHEDGDAIVQCPVCKHTGPLMRAFSLLAAGFNGVQTGDDEDCDLQECSQCGAKHKWDNVPVEEELYET